MASAGAATMLFAHGSEPAADQLTKTTDSMNSVIIYFTHTGNTELAAKELSCNKQILFPQFSAVLIPHLRTAS